MAALEPLPLDPVAAAIRRAPVVHALTEEQRAELAQDVLLFAGSAAEVDAFRRERCGDEPTAPGVLIRSAADLDAFLADEPCASST